MPIFTRYERSGEFNSKIYIGNWRIKLKLNFLSCLDQIGDGQRKVSGFRCQPTIEKFRDLRIETIMKNRS